MKTLSNSLLVLLGLAGLLTVCAADEGVQFSDVPTQTAEFMRYYKEIELTDTQKAVMTEALTPLPAPCCQDRSALTCCCPCNQARTWWGLSKHLIADRGWDAEQVREKVVEWFEFTHDTEPAGDACYTGRCGLPFKKDGCGGMSEARVAF